MLLKLRKVYCLQINEIKIGMWLRARQHNRKEIIKQISNCKSINEFANNLFFDVFG